MDNPFRYVVVTFLALAVGACTVSKQAAPGLNGPSEFALSFSLTASPDSIFQDGGSQAVIRVSAFDASGKALAGQSFRIDMAACSGIADVGTLSAKTVATASDGRATFVYTAPPAQYYCPAGESVDTVEIYATPIGTNFQTVQYQSVRVKLLPLGVILPPGSTPTAAFSYSPAGPTVAGVTTFDASASLAGPVTGQIVSYAWDFGDGSTGAGKIVNKTFSTARPYAVTLTVTNDVGLSASTTQTVSVSNPAAPTVDFTFGPTPVVVGQFVNFDGSASKAATGHSLVSYEWNYQDGDIEFGVLQSHDFLAAGVYNVTLKVTDDAGQTNQATKSVTVGTGVPTAAFTLTRAGSTITVDGSNSSAVGGATIATYAWNWGDATSNPASAAVIATHDYSTTLGAGTYTVTLTVVDSLSRTNSTSQSVTIP